MTDKTAAQKAQARIEAALGRVVVIRYREVDTVTTIETRKVEVER